MLSRALKPGGGTIPGSATSVLISNQGVTTLGYYATDNAGNVESAHSLSVRIDTAPPVPVVPASVTTNATSAAGAVVSYAVSATDNLDPAPSIGCLPSSGSMFPIGTTTVTCSASDAAGNAASATFPVIVDGGAAQIGNLIDLLNGMGLARGLTNSLSVKLRDANSGNMAAACGKLAAFINEVRAQTGKGLTSAQASLLLSSANQIAHVLGCS